MKCPLCKKNDCPEEGPFSICFDPDWRRNVWGGETHYYMCQICNECGDELAVQKGTIFDHNDLENWKKEKAERAKATK